MSSRAMNFTNLIFRTCTFVLFTGFFWTIFKLPSNLEHEYNGFDSDNSTTSIWDKLINFLRFYSDHINMEIQDNQGTPRHPRKSRKTRKSKKIKEHQEIQEKTICRKDT